MIEKIKRNFIIAFVLANSSSAHAEIVSTFGNGANQFTMTFAPIGSPGNAADTTGVPNPAGAVSYNYLMGKYEVSRDMVNKANSQGGLGITLTDMTSRGGNGPNRPATGVTWNEAARFVNWLNTSSGGFSAYKFTTAGVNDNISLWTPDDTLDFNAANPFRSLRSNYVLPSVDEWYKTAYYDPSSATYFEYPTGSNTLPTAVIGGTTANTAVFNQTFAQGPADITNAGGLSAYGIMALGGNVAEWEETQFDGFNNSASSARGIRGGDYGPSSIDGLSSSNRAAAGPSLGFFAGGFRVASLSSTGVPEPSSMLEVMLGLSGLMYRRQRRRAAIS